MIFSQGLAMRKNIIEMRKNDQVPTFGSWLRESRETRAWSQAHLSRLLGSSWSTINKWESGERRPKPSAIHKIAEVFGVNPGALARVAYGKGKIEDELSLEKLSETACKFKDQCKKLQKDNIAMSALEDFFYLAQENPRLFITVAAEIIKLAKNERGERENDTCKSEKD